VKEFAVTAETHQGKVMVLRRGFMSRQEAEAHPVKLSLWKSVWVEEMKATPKPIETPPPFPWTVLWCAGRAYLVDAEGRKFASLLGSQKRREFVAEILTNFSEGQSA